MQMLEKCDSSNRQKLLVASFSISVRFTTKFDLVFGLNTGKRFFLEVSF